MSDVRNDWLLLALFAFACGYVFMTVLLSIRGRDE